MQKPNGLPQNWKELDQILLLHFVRQWSGASLITQTHVSGSAAKYFPHVLCCEVDVESHASLMEEFRISQVPCLLILRKGKVLASFNGLFPQQKLETKIRDLLSVGVVNSEWIEDSESK